MVRKFTVYYEMATAPKPRTHASVMEPRFVDKYGEDVIVPDHAMTQREVIQAVKFLMANRFNKIDHGGFGRDRVTIQEVFE